MLVDEDLAELIRQQCDELQAEQRPRQAPREAPVAPVPVSVPSAVHIASGLIWPIFVAVVLAVGLVVGMVSYGPVLACYVTGGEPAMNAVGAEWCEKNDDGELSPATAACAGR